MGTNIKNTIRQLLVAHYSETSIRAILFVVFNHILPKIRRYLIISLHVYLVDFYQRGINLPLMVTGSGERIH